MSTTSTYMSFPISTIGVDSGLNWETNLNAALTSIDSHNHSPGQGIQIQPSGLNINSDLPLLGNNLIAVRAVRFSPQSAAIPNTGSDTGQIYVAGNELWYNDVSGGNQVQLTLNGGINATSSGISNGTATAAFSAGILVVKSSSSSFANVALQSVVLANSGNLVNQLTLQAPALSSSYALTLPAVPGSNSFMTLDPSGNMAGSIPVIGSLTTSNLSPTAGITFGQLVASMFESNVTTVTSSGNFTVPANVNRLDIIGVGGGGGAGGVATSAAQTGGAGGGSTPMQYSIAVTPGEVIAIVIGAGGGGSGPGGSVNGANGGNTTLTYSGGTLLFLGGTGGQGNGGGTGGSTYYSPVYSVGPAQSGGSSGPGGGQAGISTAYVATGAAGGSAFGGIWAGGGGGSGLGPGSAGTNAVASAACITAANATNPGSGGGASGASSVYVSGGKGGDGAPGAVIIAWVGQP